MNGCGTLRTDLGAYAVGGLDGVRAEEVGTHLRTCTACAGEYRELRSTVGLLALAAEASPPAPDHLRRRLLTGARRVRRRRRRAGILAAAVAVVAVIAGGAVTMIGTDPATDPVADPRPQVEVALASAEPYEVDGAVTFVPASDGGVRIRLVLDGLEPLGGDGVYEAWLYRDDGGIDSIGRLPDDERSLTVEMYVDGELDDYRTFWVTAEPDRHRAAHEGPTVVRTPVPRLR